MHLLEMGVRREGCLTVIFPRPPLSMLLPFEILLCKAHRHFLSHALQLEKELDNKIIPFQTGLSVDDFLQGRRNIGSLLTRYKSCKTWHMARIVFKEILHMC
jgi:hypothetical protein